MDNGTGAMVLNEICVLAFIILVIISVGLVIIGVIYFIKKII
jgi:hypothetical protein